MKLQLLTYLLVAQNTTLQLYNMENAIPAGILYCFLKTPVITGTNKLSVQQIKTEIEKKNAYARLGTSRSRNHQKN